MSSSPSEGIFSLTLDSIHRCTTPSSLFLKQELTFLISSFFLAHIEKKKFCVIPGKICWQANIDVFVLGNLDFSILDGVGLGIRGALADLRIPKVKCTFNKITEEHEVELESEHSTSVDRIETEDFPFICTLGEVDLDKILKNT